VFLLEGPRVAGVNQVSSVDGSHRLQYAFNASEAREVCHSLGLTIASKAQVQSALTQGYQTCRWGYIPHFSFLTAQNACFIVMMVYASIAPQVWMD